MGQEIVDATSYLEPCSLLPSPTHAPVMCPPHSLLKARNKARGVRTKNRRQGAIIPPLPAKQWYLQNYDPIEHLAKSIASATDFRGICGSRDPISVARLPGTHHANGNFVCFFWSTSSRDFTRDRNWDTCRGRLPSYLEPAIDSLATDSWTLWGYRFAIVCNSCNRGDIDV